MAKVGTAKLRLYLEGVEVPAQAVTVYYTLDQGATLMAQLAIPEDGREFLSWIFLAPQVEAIAEIDGQRYYLFHGVLFDYSFVASGSALTLHITAKSFLSQEILSIFKLHAIDATATLGLYTQDVTQIKTSQAWLKAILASTTQVHEAFSRILSMAGTYGGKSKVPEIEKKTGREGQDEKVTIRSKRSLDCDYCGEASEREYSYLPGTWLELIDYEDALFPMPFWGNLRWIVNFVYAPPIAEPSVLRTIDWVLRPTASQPLMTLWNLFVEGLKFTGLRFSPAFVNVAESLGFGVLLPAITWWPRDLEAIEIGEPAIPVSEFRQLPSTTGLLVLTDDHFESPAVAAPSLLCVALSADPQEYRFTFTAKEQWQGMRRKVEKLDATEFTEAWKKEELPDVCSALRKYLSNRWSIVSEGVNVQVTTYPRFDVVPGLPVKLKLWNVESVGIVQSVAHTFSSTSASTTVGVANVRPAGRKVPKDLEFLTDSDLVEYARFVVSNVSSPLPGEVAEKPYRTEMRDFFRRASGWLANVGFSVIESVLKGRWFVPTQPPTWELGAMVDLELKKGESTS